MNTALNVHASLGAASTENALSVFQGQFGFPNGRRLGDDVVDIYLRVAMGGLCSPAFTAFIKNFRSNGVAILAPLDAVLTANCPSISAGHWPLRPQPDHGMLMHP